VTLDTEYASLLFLGPPGQVAAIAGKKAGMKQGELGGILKELGYTEEQVRTTESLRKLASSDISPFRCTNFKQ
jgi:cytochrome-b5 reductase